MIDPRTQDFRFAHGLRALAAVYVAAFHLFLGIPDYNSWPRWIELSTRWLRHGNVAVGLFLALSGFLLMAPIVAARGRIAGGATGFYMRRARRILPPYYAAYALFLVCWQVYYAVIMMVKGPGGGMALSPYARLCLDQSYRFDNIVAHLLLIHPFRPAWSNCPNAIFWTIGVEWHVYLVFPIILVPIWRLAGPVAVLVATYAVGLWPVYGAAGVEYMFPWIPGTFAWGMLAATLAVSPNAPYRELRERLPWGAISVTVFAMLVWLVRLSPGYYVGATAKQQWPIDAWAGAASCVLLVALSEAQRRRAAGGAGARWPMARLAEVLSHPVLAVVAAFSYSLYLTHGVVVMVLARIMAVLGLRPAAAALLMLGAGLPLALAFGWVFHLAFERPFAKSRRPKPSLAPGPTLPDPAP